MNMILKMLFSMLPLTTAAQELSFGHVQMIQGLKTHFAKKESANTSIKQSTTKTATQAYLSLPKLCALVEKDWKNELVTYKDIFAQMKAREKELNDTHYVFYHGQNDVFRTLHDVLNRIYETLFLHASLDNFYMMRVWYDFLETANMNTFMDEYERNTSQVWNDQGGPLVAKLLSVNFSIFGNTNQNGECTIKAFIRNRSYFYNSITPALTDVFKKLHLDQKYIQEIDALAQSIATPEGTIYQIFVPKDRIDDCAYLCHRWAPPYSTPLVKEDFDTKKQRHKHIAPIIELYKQDPATIGADELDRLQARLLFSQDLLLNPDSGVKMFRYTTIPESKQEHYEQELDKIISKLFGAWFSSGDYKKAVCVSAVSQSPLARLLNLKLK